MIKGAQMGKSFARQRSQRFNWQKLVTPWTPKSFVVHCTAVQKEISMKKTAAQSLSADVPKIDWAHWESVIKAPGVVEALKKEYEGLKFTEASTGAHDALKKQGLEHIAVAEASLATTKKERVAADKALAKFEKIQSEGLHFTTEQWIDTMPGMEKEMSDMYDDEEYIPNDEEERIAALDFGEVEKEFVAGQFSQQIPENLVVGDKSLAEEKEVIEAGEWSIERIFVDKDAREILRDNIRKANASAGTGELAATLAKEKAELRKQQDAEAAAAE